MTQTEMGRSRFLTTAPRCSPKSSLKERGTAASSHPTHHPGQVAEMKRRKLPQMGPNLAPERQWPGAVARTPSRVPTTRSQPGKGIRPANPHTHNFFPQKTTPNFQRCQWDRVTWVRRAGVRNKLSVSAQTPLPKNQE